MPQIVPRARWGARPWAAGQEPPTVPASTRRYFVVHYDGGAPVLREGASIPRAIDAEHRARGWAGIGYNFVVAQDGTVYEGRGWDLVGAHCPGRNRDGIGVQVAIGGDQQPTPAALHAVRALYDEACRRAGHTLTKGRHGDYYPTDCCGARLTPWVRAGMPDPTPGPAAAPGPTPSPEEDTLAVTRDDLQVMLDDTVRKTADAITSIRARNPVLVDEGTGAAELQDGTGRDIDALPTVVGEIQHEQRRQAGVLDELLAAVRALGGQPTP